MSELIFVDEKDKVLKRETKGAGRPPRGSVRQAEDGKNWKEGDFIVYPVKPKFIPCYIDEDGNRTLKGRGRPKPGYEKMTEGKEAGHWMQVGSPVSV